MERSGWPRISLETAPFTESTPRLPRGATRWTTPDPSRRWSARVIIRPGMLSDRFSTYSRIPPNRSFRPCGARDVDQLPSAGERLRQRSAGRHLHPDPARLWPNSRRKTGSGTPANRERNRTAQLGNREKQGLRRLLRPDPRSPVRSRLRPHPKTPRIRGNFCLRLALSSRSLRLRGLDGGANGIRTSSISCWGESEANPNRATRRPRNSNSRYGSSESRPSLGRIKSESEPPNSPTEKNAGCCAFDAPNPPSPVRIHEGSSAKTPRIRGDFSGCVQVRARSLCDRRLDGGESGIRTHGTLPGTHAFQACAFNHSAISPENLVFSERRAHGRPRSKPGGEGGIRTLDELLTHTPLAGERLQPLGHLSGTAEDSRGAGGAQRPDPLRRID
jgi:hypothetical protein